VVRIRKVSEVEEGSQGATLKKGGEVATLKNGDEVTQRADFFPCIPSTSPPRQVIFIMLFLLL
jgi:hypothetical protein